MMKLKPLIWLVGLLLYVFPATAQEVLIDVLKDEMSKQQQELKKQSVPIYLISYRVDDKKGMSIFSSFGNVKNKSTMKVRYISPLFRLGDYKFDNFRAEYAAGPQVGLLPVAEDDELAIRGALWQAANETFQQALNNYQQADAKKKTSVENEDKSDAYTQAPVVNYYEKPQPAVNLETEVKTWSDKMNAISAVFKEYPRLLTGTAGVNWEQGRFYYLNSEGSLVVQNRTYARIFVTASAKAADGMDLPLSLSYFAFTLDKLPTTEQIVADAHQLAKKVESLLDAPVAEPYTGPALLSGSAAGVFFHEIFGHRIEGQRLKNENDAQTFKKMVGKQLLPTDLQVYDDPTLAQLNGLDLNGYYLYDDEGVKSERVDVIRDGVLSDFLMTRVPIDGFSRSNGHARASLGYAPVSRQGNLVLESKNPKSQAELKKLLIDEAKVQGKDYGYLFVQVTGGFTYTGRSMANSFNVFPTEVYRIYVDGRPDELVRGVNLVGTPLSMFSNISHAGNDVEIFTGICGAESGQIPVTCIAPSVLVQKVETQRANKSQELPPVLARP